MKKFVLASMVCAGFALTMADTVQAHGGQYRGPGDVVPPNPGSGGAGRTPGPSGPVAPGGAGPAGPGPAGPVTGGAAGPGGAAPGGPAGASAAAVTGVVAANLTDLTKWQFWWEFNKDPFINLRAAIHTSGTVTASDDFFMGAGKSIDAKDTMKPTEEQINGLLPELKGALDSTDQRDITSSCLVAMAKIGKDHETFEILPLFKDKLTSGDQEIRETAAVAMGISQMANSVDDLAGLVTDSDDGRKLMDRGEVDDRTRSFSAYGLGLVTYAVENSDVKTKAFTALKEVLEDDDIASRNIRVAVINAMGLLRPNATDEKGEKLLKDSLAALETFYMADRGRGEELIQAHVPPAIAKLLRDAEGEFAAQKRAEYKEMFLKELRAEKRSNEIIQSVVTALGRMCDPYDGKDSADGKYSEELFKYYKDGKDQQATYYALMAMGQIGGEKNRENLLYALERGQDALQKPWAAVSLGVLSHNLLEAQQDVDPTVGRAMLKWFKDVRNPDARAALAIGLGLARYKESSTDLRAMLQEEKNQDELAGYLCVGLALMDEQGATEQIKDLVRNSVRRPERLQQAAIALGKLGDKQVTELLQEMMQEGDQNLAKMSAIASALGFIGDRRTIPPLLEMLKDESLTDLTRAFAAVALGGVADKELLPWNSKIGINMNYRAAVETLTDGSAGILDIL